MPGRARFGQPISVLSHDFLASIIPSSFSCSGIHPYPAGRTKSLTRGGFAPSLRPDHLFKSLPILVPELGRTLQPYPAGSHPSGQPPSRLPYTRTHFDAPAPEGYFKYRIDFPVPVGYSGRLLYSGATNFRAGIALNPECHYSLRREEWSDRAGDFMPDLPDLGPD